MNNIIPLPTKMLRDWIKSGSYALAGATFAKLFRRSPCLAARSFAAVSDAVTFLQEGDIIVAHPDFEAFLCGYRQQYKRMRQAKNLSDCFLFGSYFSPSQPVDTLKMDHWQQIRYLARSVSVNLRPLPLFCDAEVLQWPKRLRPFRSSR